MTIIILLFSIIALGAQENLEVEGSVKLSNSKQVAPLAGTIRWTGYDYEGFNGFEWISLTGASSESTVTDIDGNIYQTKKIGNQVWMTENLRTTKYRNGTTIPNITIGAQWAGLSTGAWSHYDNITSFEVPYGKLYNWFAVQDPNGLCPEGWILPLHTDYLQLANYLGGLSNAGGSMKEEGVSHWVAPNEFATNFSGFTGLPGGIRGSDASFQLLSTSGAWWTGTTTSSQAHSFSLFNNSAALTQVMTDKIQGRSVRCIRSRGFD
ncbi:MAG: fibrobacter succinogenes major paralogous domain-containing protein [Saprospiraceae bacterium]|nr:fibrobacter succinogenes major paralogous domain-containing protein [Saprospiraceae bacterium]